MSPKPPIRGTAIVDVHPRPGAVVSGQAPRTRVSSAGARPPARYTPDSPDLDAIRRVPAVTITAASSSPVSHRPEMRSLEDYWQSADIRLPPADDQGLRTFKGRDYVDLSDDRVALVKKDPDTGLYRARLPSELSPSGPVLIRDAQSRLWHPLDDARPATFLLSDARLEAFRTALDFSGIEPGTDRLYRFNGKLYAVIAEHAYQVLHDLDASSPRSAVMRIVHPADPVARDHGNIYIGTRPGRSEPIVFDARHGWVAAQVGGTSGMRRRGQTSAASHSADLALELRLMDLELEQAITMTDQLGYRWLAAKDKQNERNILVQLEDQHRRELGILEKTVSLHLEHKEAVVAIKGREAYKNKLITLRKGQILSCNQLMIANDSRKLLDGPIFGGPDTEYRAVATHLADKLVVMKQREHFAEELLHKWRLSEEELKAAAYDPIEIHEIVAFWVYAESRTLPDAATSLASHDFNAKYLAYSFGQVTFSYRALKGMPEETRVAVLSSLFDQCTAIRAAFEHMPLPPGAEPARSHAKIVEAVQAFETTLEESLNRYHRQLLKTSMLPAHEQPIDFDFIPPQDRSAPPASLRRVFRARHHGVDKIKVGRPRRSETGVEVIDVMSPVDAAQVMHTYALQEGQWRPIVPLQATPLPGLRAQAGQQLQRTQSWLDRAWQDEREKRNATNIVEFLVSKADACDHLARQIDTAPDRTDADTVTFVQRLQQDSLRLRSEGEHIRIRLYKDKAFLSADRLAYLIAKEQISVVQTQPRTVSGKGSDKHFLDVYSLNDRSTGAPLWHAHFHYDRMNSPKQGFTARGGHLKTLEQSRLGISSQRRDARSGHEHAPIWRESIDGKTAQKIFELAT
ncbi:hypothetical protein ACX64L_02680 [Pseudomonas monsensis]